MAANELVILNRGKTDTCVRAQGTSIVDITLGTEAAMKIVKSWEVDGNEETLSDHKYIVIQIDRGESTNKYTGGIKFPKWNVKKIDLDWYIASVVGGNWIIESRNY